MYFTDRTFVLDVPITSIQYASEIEAYHHTIAVLLNLSIDLWPM